MPKLTVLTFADSPLRDTNYLKKSCKQLGLHLQVIIHSPWTVNAIKIKLLHEHLQIEDPEEYTIVVDAFDVVFFEDQETILQKFKTLQADIVFSAESNFYFRNKKLLKSYWKNYPRNGTPYDYLNSGTYMGKNSDLKWMIDTMISKGDVNLDEQEIQKLRSDQYAFSKNYVDTSKESSGKKIALDHHQTIMGCTGGRFNVIKFPDFYKMQALLFFILERNILKYFSLHHHQKISKDFTYKEGRFVNTKTSTKPSIMHFPGTWASFEKVYDSLLNNEKPSKSGTWFIAALISVICLPLSFLGSMIVRLPKD